MRYTGVEFEIIEFETEDVIITSGDCYFNGGVCDFDKSGEKCPLDNICVTNFCDID